MDDSSYPRTVTDALLALESHRAHGYTFLGHDGQAVFRSFGDIVAAARSAGAMLRDEGLRRGDRVVLIIPDTETFVVGFFAALLAGGVPVPLYPPFALGRLEYYLEHTAGLIRQARARMVVAPRRLKGILWPVTETARSVAHILAAESLIDSRPRAFEPEPADPDDLAFIQFTSGSTRASRGVQVSHANLVANCIGIVGEGLQLDSTKDKGLSWLPLYHDMGLIGFVIAPLFVPVSVVLMPTTMFLRRPLQWLDLIHRHRATVTFAPNFAYALVTSRATDAHVRRWDLSCLRVAGCGAETISARTLRAFEARFAPADLPAEALLPSYGMAEATLSISFKPLGTRWKSDMVDGPTFREKGQAVPALENAGDTLEFVSCGRWFRRHAVRVVDEQGEILPERSVGEIVVSGPSVTRGYTGGEEASADTYKDGWLHTGDLGYIAEGELYVSGRKKDVIVINGRNYLPEAIEWAVGDILGVRRGNVVAFSRPGERGTEELVIACEVRTRDLESLRKTIAARVNEAFGLPVADIVFLPARTLPKTTSGKVQRQKTRELYARNALAGAAPRAGGREAALSTLLALRMRSMVSRVRHSTRRVLKPEDQEPD